MPLGVEQRDLVEAADGQAERGGALIDGQRALRAGVQPTEIEREPPVDEDPDVVVAAEGQRLAAAVLEEVTDLGGEAEVVGDGRR